MTLSKSFAIWKRSLGWCGGCLLGVAGFLSLPGAAGAADLREAEPLFSFGLIADVQYADKDPSGKRRYRESLTKLERCLADLNDRPLAFIVNLGDTIDGRDDQSLVDLGKVLKEFARSRAPVRHVVGNHCLEAPLRELMDRFGLTNSYYAFESHGWQFLALDTMEISLKAEPDSEQRREAEAWVARDPKLPTYNGAIGPVQIQWLRSQLTDARQGQRPVVLLSHHPLATVAGHESLLLWNAEAVRRVLAEAGSVVACFAGHDHAGAYAVVEGIHYLTVPGMVEASPTGNRYAVVDVFPDRLEFRGMGEVKSRVLQVDEP
jgi:hypothetical protein